MKKKALVISSFPAPYRINVFRRLSLEYDLDVFFGLSTNEDRNDEWYGKSGEFQFEVLGTVEADIKYKLALKKIRHYDFVIAYDVNQIPAFKAIYLCKKYKIPYFVNCDGAILKKNIVKDIVKRYLFSSATGCFSSGKSATNYFLNYGANLSNIYTHRFTSLSEEDILRKPISNKREIRKMLDLPEKMTVITVGQFIPRKGFDILLNAWKLVNQDYQLLIIGGGAEKNKYFEFVKQNNLTNVIIKDFMKKDELFLYYQASDLFVLPTREDIWGLVINEALANGLPIITTDNCVAGVELVKNDINGYIVPVNNIDSLFHKIAKVMSNKKLRSKMVAKNINLIQGCTMENIAISHIKAINDSLSSKIVFKISI